MMMSYSLRWIEYNLTIIFFLIIITNSLLDSGYEDENILNIVKRDLICREKEYLKIKPLSENLKNFIRRVKRNNQKTSKPKGNKDLLKSMYVLRGGNIVPLKPLNIRDTAQSNDAAMKESNVLEGRFTVVPLIVPKNNFTEEECIETPPGPSKFLGPSTTCIDELESNATINSTSTIKPPLKMVETVDDYDIVPVEITTKGELLGNVIKDVKELIKFENKFRPQGEAGACNVTGDWDSFAGGMQIRISFGVSEMHGRLPRIPRIVLVPLEPPRDGFLADNSWNGTGVAPFANSSMIALTLVSTTSKRVATFLGECRICEGAESITGHWMVRHRSKNCKDREEANTFFSDVLRKNNIRKLQVEHLEQLMSTAEPKVTITVDVV